MRLPRDPEPKKNPEMECSLFLFLHPTDTIRPPHEEPTPQPFDTYYYAEEIEIGRLKGTLSITQDTTLEGSEKNINALAVFFNGKKIGLVAAPVRTAFKRQDRSNLPAPGLRRTLRSWYQRRYQERAQADTPAIVFPRLLSAEIHNTILFQRGIPAETVNQLIDNLYQMQNISSEKKKLLLLLALQKIPSILEAFPARAHQDLRPENVLIDKNFHVYLIDFGKLRNFYYTKRNDLQYFFTELRASNIDAKRNVHKITNLLGTNALNPEVVHTLLQDAIQKQGWNEELWQTQQESCIKEYTLKRLGYLIDKERHFHHEELAGLTQQIEQLYVIDKTGKGAPTVLLPYTGVGG